MRELKNIQARLGDLHPWPRLLHMVALILIQEHQLAPASIGRYFSGGAKRLFLALQDMDPAKIQDLFFRRLYINYSESVKPSHVKIERMDGGWKMSVSYEVRRPLVGNLDVVGKFDASEPLTRRAPE